MCLSQNDLDVESMTFFVFLVGMFLSISVYSVLFLSPTIKQMFRNCCLLWLMFDMKMKMPLHIPPLTIVYCHIYSFTLIQSVSGTFTAICLVTSNKKVDVLQENK